jgi:DNA-directed RNA polymerase subunit D
MTMKTLEKTKEKISFITDMDISLANAIRRSSYEIPVLAVDEVEILKNDSALYDEIIAHRLGLIPLKNQKIKEGETIEMKLKAKGKGAKTLKVMSGELGELVVYPDMPIVFLDDGQEIELIARARTGKGIKHAKFSPGLIYYKHLPKIKITAEGEKHSELAEIYPEVFSFDGKLKVKDETARDLSEDDFVDFPGVSISFDENLVFYIESWGQMEAKEIFVEACKALKENVLELAKELK